MPVLKKSATWVQFDVGHPQRFQLYVDGAVLPTNGLACEVRLQRVDANGDAIGAPLTVPATAADAGFWTFTLSPQLTSTPGDFDFEARISDGGGDVRRWPDEERAIITIRPVRTGGSS